jgi:hypothetical protein
MTAPISMLSAADRGSKFIEPIYERRRSMTIAFECSPMNFALTGGALATVTVRVAHAKPYLD